MTQADTPTSGDDPETDETCLDARLAETRGKPRAFHSARRFITETPANPTSRRPDSNRGPLHYEFRAAVTTSHEQSPQVTRCAEAARLAVTHGDLR
jgi:hypothetical protein